MNSENIPASTALDFRAINVVAILSPPLKKLRSKSTLKMKLLLRPKKGRVRRSRRQRSRRRHVREGINRLAGNFQGPTTTTKLNRDDDEHDMAAAAAAETAELDRRIKRREMNPIKLS